MESKGVIRSATARTKMRRLTSLSAIALTCLVALPAIANPVQLAIQPASGQLAGMEQGAEVVVSRVGATEIRMVIPPAGDGHRVQLLFLFINRSNAPVNVGPDSFKTTGISVVPYEKLMGEQQGREGVRKFGHFLSSLGNVLIAQSAGTSTGSYSYSGMTSNGTIYSGGGTVTVTDPYVTQQALAQAYTVNAVHGQQMNQNFMAARAAIDANMRTTTLMPNQQIRGVLTFELPHSIPSNPGGQPFSLIIQMGSDRHVLNGVLGQPGTLPAIAPSPELAAYVAQQTRQPGPAMPLGQDNRQSGLQPAVYVNRQSGAALPPASPDLAAMIQKTAEYVRTPMQLGDRVTLIHIEPLGNQIQLTARVDAPLSVISDDARRRIVGEMCGHPALMPLLHYGASARMVYVSPNGREIGAVMVTRDICGFR